MLEFIRRHAGSVMGVINGFDRLRFRGTLLRIANAAGLRTFLSYTGVLLKDAGDWMNERTERIKEASLAMAKEAGRPVQYLNDLRFARKTWLGRLPCVTGLRTDWCVC